MTRLARGAWLSVLFLACVALLLRLSIALSSAPSIYSSFGLIGILLCMYALFLFEGLQHCAIQINDADPEGLKEYIQNNISESSRDQVASLAARLKSNFDLFLTGRNMCSMVNIVLIAAFIDSIPIDAKNFFYNFMETAGPNYKHVAEYALHSFLSIFLLSTLLPCWVAQLLPQLLADQKSVAFIQLPFAGYATSLAIWVARIEIGWPSEMMYRRIQSLNKFKKKEQFRIGEGTLFERLSDIFAQSISVRNITICLDQSAINVSDQSEIVFTRIKTSTIRHTVKVAQKEGFVAFRGWNFLFPPGVTHDKPHARTVSVYTAVDLGAGSSERELDSVLLSFETALEAGLPRDGQDRDSVMLTAEYIQRPPDLDPKKIDELFVFVSKPTGLVDIFIQTSGDIFIITPKISYQILDDASRLVDESIKLTPKSFKITKELSGWRILVDHPPLNSRFSIVLDVRVLNPEVDGH